MNRTYWRTSATARQKAEQIIPLIGEHDETFHHQGQRARENTRRAADRRALAGLFTFLENHDLPVWPLTEQNVLRYLHSVPRKARTMEMVGQAVNRWHTAHGINPVCGDRTRAYVKAVTARQQAEGTLLAPKTDGILLADAEQVIPRIFQPTPRAATDQALVRIAADTGESLRNICFANPDTYVHNETTSTVSVRLENGHTLVARQDTTPDVYTALVTLAAIGRPAHHWDGRFAKRPEPDRRRRLRNALASLGVNCNPWTDRNIMSTLTPLQRHAVVDAAGGETAQSAARDTFLIILGVTGGYRYSDIEYLPADGFQPNAGGYTATIPFSKTDPNGDGRTIHIHHINPDQECGPYQPCDVLCPVAAYERYLWVTRLTLGTTRTVTWLFQGDNGHPLRNTSLTNQLRKVWLRCGGNPDYKIGTRSLRVGALTSGYLEGMPFNELAELANHRKLDSTRIYLRPGTINPFTLDPHQPDTP